MSDLHRAFFQIEQAIFDYLQLPDPEMSLNKHDLLYYMTLRSFMNAQKRSAFPSVNRVSKKCGMSQPMGTRCNQKLSALKLIIIRSGKETGTSNTYYLPPVDPPNEDGINPSGIIVEYMLDRNIEPTYDNIAKLLQNNPDLKMGGVHTADVGVHTADVGGTYSVGTNYMNRTTFINQPSESNDSHGSTPQVKKPSRSMGKDVKKPSSLGKDTPLKKALRGKLSILYELGTTPDPSAYPRIGRNARWLAGESVPGYLKPVYPLSAAEGVSDVSGEIAKFDAFVDWYHATFPGAVFPRDLHKLSEHWEAYHIKLNPKPEKPIDISTIHDPTLRAWLELERGQV